MMLATVTVVLKWFEAPQPTPNKTFPK